MRTIGNACGAVAGCSRDLLVHGPDLAQRKRKALIARALGTQSSACLLGEPGRRRARRCEIMRGGMEQYMTPMGPTKLHVMPLFEIGPLEPRFSEWLVFEGARPRPLERLLEWLALEAARPRPWQALCALQQAHGTPCA